MMIDGQSDGRQIYTITLICLLSLLTRFYEIHEPAHVCWDETHFGKMASWYINGTFFFDVHPPLGKMLIAASGWLTGYDGRFPFEKPGDEYQHWTQYVGMRIFCASLGILIPIFGYYSTKAMTKSELSAKLAALLILFDNGLITLTRYILLDSPLLFFIASSILGMSKISFEYCHQQDNCSNQFSKSWWFWLIWTGISIACAFSVKFVGLFIIFLVGFKTIHDLWLILGDTQRPISYFMKHFIARAICLILLPALIYIGIFWIHLRQLNHSGNGDGFYSSAFQSRLIGNPLHNSSWPAHLAYDAQVTLKNNRIGGAYLHSHWHLYPEGVGARQQQVTSYAHKDSNNKWLIKRAFQPDADRLNDIFVRDGDLILLEHMNTKRNLHSHFEMAPMTKRHYQVTCYGENGIGDANDIWQIKKETKSSSALNINLLDKKEEDNRIYTVKTRFMLIHYLTQCALHSHSTQLPKWGYEQLEVTCNPKLHHKDNYWNIEDNYYPQLANVSFEAYAPSFMERFLESHAVMLQGNSGLKPKEGEVTSRPWQWPINYKGQFFSASKGQKVYLLGNPIIWWLNIFNIPASLLILSLLALMAKLKNPASAIKPNANTNQVVKKTNNSNNKKSPKRNPKKENRQEKQDTAGSIISGPEVGDKEVGSPFNIEKTYVEASSWTLLGWFIHYAPFYFMGRVLYFHHYFPAFIFSSMLTAMNFDFLLTLTLGKMLPNLGEQSLAKRKGEFAILLAAIVIYTYFKFVPITYGTKESNLIALNDGDQLNDTEGGKRQETSDWRSEQKLSSLKWLDSWEF